MQQKVPEDTLFVCLSQSVTLNCVNLNCVEKSLTDIAELQSLNWRGNQG